MIERLRSAAGARPALVVLVAAALPLLLTLSPEWPGLNGDEPHYVVMAESLISDGDLELSGDYDDSRLSWLAPQLMAPHTKPGAEPGSAYSFHGSGLALLLVPWVAVDPSPPQGLRLSGVLFSFVLGLAILRAARRAGRDLPALPIAVLALVTAPIAFNTPHVFPDLPAAALTAWAWLLVTGRRRAPGQLLAAGVALGFLPWLHFKFLLLWAVVLALGIEASRRSSSPRLERAALALPAVGGLVALCGWNLLTLGSASPMATAVYPEALAELSSPLLGYFADLPSAVRTGIGLFLDQKDGLMWYSPLLLLGAAGAGWLWQRDRRLLLTLVLLFASVWGPTALSQNTGLWGPPGRWLVAVAWPLALLAGIGALAPGAPSSLRRLRSLLAGLTIAITLVYAWHPSLLYVGRANTRSPLLQFLGGPALPVWDLFPLWTRTQVPAWGATLIWLALTVVSSVWLWRLGAATAGSPEASTTASTTSPDRPLDWPWAVAAASVTTVAILLVASLSPVGGPQVTRTATYDRIRVHASSAPPSRAWPHPTTVWFGGTDRVEVWISTARPLRRLQLRVLAPVAMNGTIEVGGTSERVEMAAGETRLVTLEPSRGRTWDDRAYTRLSVHSESGIAGHEISGVASDSRWLGLNIEFVDLRLVPPRR